MISTNDSQPVAPEALKDWEGPMFLIGMPRSGTKLLRGLLNQHPRVRIPTAETEFLPFLDQWVTRHGPPETLDAFEMLYNEMRHATYFNFRPAGAAPFDWCGWRSACDGRYDVGGLFEGFVRYELQVPRGSGVIWADKSPAYMRCVPLLLQRFPRGRVVHLVRDVRDYCVSIRKAWNKDIRRAAHRWAEDVHAAHVHCHEHPDRCLEVRYEELLQHPARELRRICLFLGIEYIDALAKLNRSVENYGDAKGRAAIVRDNYNKFEARLTEREIAAVEGIAWDTMRELGYTATRAQGPRRLGRRMQQWLRVKDGYRLIVGDIPKLGVLGAVRFHTGHQRMIGNGG